MSEEEKENKGELVTKSEEISNLPEQKKEKVEVEKERTIGWGRWALNKATRVVVGHGVAKASKYAFWSGLVFFGPLTVVSTVGIPAVAATALLVHSGVIEYVADKAVSSAIEN